MPKKHSDINMGAPALNDEIKLNLKDEAIKRDKYFYTYQNMSSAGLSLTAMVLSMILNERKRTSGLRCSFAIFI